MKKILILCGGRGKRMGKKSILLPKPLQQINGRSILEHKIHYYYEEGIRKVVIAIGYKGDLIKKHLNNLELPKDLMVEFSETSVNTGILKRISSSIDLFDDKFILFSYGDTFTNIDINKLLDAHNNSDNFATIVTAPFKNPFGLIEFDSSYKITSFEEKPILKYYIGYAIINKSTIKNIDNTIINMKDGEGIVSFYNSLLKIKKLGAYHHDDLHVTFNTPEEFKVAEKELIKFVTVKE